MRAEARCGAAGWYLIKIKWEAWVIFFSMAWTVFYYLYSYNEHRLYLTKVDVDWF